ncbi:MAG: hypothetical protein E3J71_01005 [Candidatus Stahlbacteria bacterium]|nr:MAG: hypothetical protein E3J71_01005 [Candidatus Stahlbacteria bacterium]
MRVSIRDPKVLQEVDPQDLLIYLDAHGWKESESSIIGKAAWILKRDEEEFEVLVPLDKSYRDYAMRISDALKVLEVVEDRSQIDILKDIQAASVDLIRIKPDIDRSEKGSIPLIDGVALVEKAKELMLAAACAAVSARKTYPTQKPHQALKYLENVRLGQTEEGSYIITIHSPVSPEKTPLKLEAEPFERKVTKTLIHAFEAILNAAEIGSSTGDLKLFEESVKRGVSSNLCDAIVDLQEETHAKSLSVNISWSPILKVPKGTRSSVEISANLVPTIKKASQMFKGVEPETLEKTGFVVKGFVINLHREYTPEGIITIATTIDEIPRKVKIELDEKDYKRAVDAHKADRWVSCTGTLIPKARAFVLSNPRKFTIEDEPPHKDKQTKLDVE